MLVLIRGAGDLATGIALRLFRSHLRVAMTDLPQPTAIRRTVCFSQAILYGSYQVEDVTAERAETEDDVRRILSAGQIPVLADPKAVCRAWLRPDVVVDAILAKKNLGTAITDAPLVIGVGPGFCAGKDCHAVIETMRGHTLGRVIRTGELSRTRISPASSAASPASACCARRTTGSSISSPISAHACRRAMWSAR